MTSIKQIEANRRNAARSTGPTSNEGKAQSRRNAVRHGLTAETVIGVLEDVEDYRAFEAAVIADYDAQSAVERELVLRLASLLWRLRRATMIETEVLAIQADRARQCSSAERGTKPGAVVHKLFRDNESTLKRNITFESSTGDTVTSSARVEDRSSGILLAKCFLGLSNLPTYPLDRLSRYEHLLWRQAAQIIHVLNALDKRKPQERRNPFGYEEL